MEPVIPVSEWENRRRLFYRTMKEKIWDYQRYARWFRSDFSEIRYPVQQKGKIVNGDLSPINLTGLVGRSFVSQLFFSPPEVMIKSVPGHDSSQLAQTLTVVGNDMVKNGGLFDEGGKCLLDGFLGPFMCMKVGYNADFTADIEKNKQEQFRAEERLRKILIGGKPRINRETDNHKIFLDVYSAGLEAVKRGDIKVTEGTQAYLEDQIFKHREFQKITGIREYEKVISERVWFRRQAPDAVWFNLTAPDLNSLEYIAFTTLKNDDELKDNPDNNLTDETVPSGTSVESEENEDLIDERLKHYLQIDSQKDHYIQHEVIDLRNNQVVVYLQGKEKNIRVKKYGMKDIMKNGAAVIGVFDEDPRLIVGIPQPKFWESQQIDACILNTAQFNTAKANVPGMAYDKDHVDAEEMEVATTSLGNRSVGLKDLDKRAVKDVISDLPLPKTTPETFSAKAEAVNFIDRLSGLGQTKLGGGDFSRTATASENIDQAVSAMTKRVSKKVDNFFLTVITYGLRIIKAYYSTQTIANIAGPAALASWPEEWSIEDIIDDRGVELIVGTMREESTPLEKKQISDLYAMVLSNPMLPQIPALQTTALKLLSYLFRLHHAPIDLQQELAEVAKQSEEAMQRQAAQAGAEGGAPAGGPTRPTEVNQPVSNLSGGGRNGGGLQP